MNKQTTFAITLITVLAAGLSVGLLVLPGMEQQADAQFRNTGECINFSENKEISKELGNFTDYVKACQQR